jgi:1-acyl-sn-glycerol-3-phosphate acyltransferase
MEDQTSVPPKPVAEVWKPEMVSLPRLTLARRIYRFIFGYLVRLFAFSIMRITYKGRENFSRKGPAIVVFNHLGDADAVVNLSSIPYTGEIIGKIENSYDHWLAGPALRTYGMIWIHRGQPDRRALRAALDALAEGRIVAIAPEGRQSVTGALEEGTDGAAFLAVKSGARLIPVALTGTENANVYGHMKRWRRADVTWTIGKPFHLHVHSDRRDAIREGTRQIMEEIACLLPKKYRGVYGYVSSPNDENDRV